MNRLNLEEIKYFHVDVLKKIRGRLQKKIYGSSGKHRILLEEDHAYLSNLITRLEKASKLHKSYLKRQKQQRK